MWPRFDAATCVRAISQLSASTKAWEPVRKWDVADAIAEPNVPQVPKRSWRLTRRG
jgi:hypothetical protein